MEMQDLRVSIIFYTYFNSETKKKQCLTERTESMERIKSFVRFILWTVTMLATGFIAGGIGGIWLSVLYCMDRPEDFNSMINRLRNTRRTESKVTEFHKPEKDSVEMGFH